MAEHRIKIKIGEDEFEAEGSVEVVQSQFDTFAELVKTLATIAKTRGVEEKPPLPGGDTNSVTPSELALDKIMRSDDRLVSLTVRPNTIQDAVLLVLLGQRHFRENDSVTGNEIMVGLRESGLGAIARIDGTLNRLSAEGYVITVGVHRGRRYRLTNTGMARAREIAQELIATVP